MTIFNSKLLSYQRVTMGHHLVRQGRRHHLAEVRRTSLLAYVGDVSRRHAHGEDDGILRVSSSRSRFKGIALIWLVV